ncbi:MAG: ABC transporter ATP-binding protein [Sphingomonadaceae bacterium]
MDGPEQPLFRLEQASRVYGSGPSAVRALDQVSIAIPRGEVVVLLGPSGSGKSTFLNILGGLDRPTEGEAWFEDRNLATLSDSALTEYRRAHVGFVFQFYNLVPSLTALENVQLVTDIADSPMDPEEALKLVGLGARARHFPSELSGGEQQRVAIARAIAKRPAVLLCDEPTGALDSRTGVAVLETLLAANEATGASLLIVTHNAGVADLSHRTIRFRDGRVVEESRNTVRRRPAEISW